jgi:hypothetical protein
MENNHEIYEHKEIDMNQLGVIVTLLLQFEWLYLSDDIVLVAEDVRNSK